METATETKTNVEVVQQAFNDFKTGNIQGVIDICTNDVVWSSAENPDVPLAGTFRGREGVMEFFRTLGNEVEMTSFEPREFLSDKDAVVVLGRNSGNVKRTGKTFNNEWCFVMRLRDGMIYDYYAYVDTLDQAKAFKN